MMWLSCLLSLYEGWRDRRKTTYNATSCSNRHRRTSRGTLRDMLLEMDTLGSAAERLKRLDERAGPDKEALMAKCDEHPLHSGNNYYPFCGLTLHQTVTVIQLACPSSHCAAPPATKPPNV